MSNANPSDDATNDQPGAPAAPPSRVRLTRPGEDKDGSAPTPHPDPTRYGDWEKNGRCIDF
ncbi:DUF1674 domain-containing protein [Dokdonella sp.]|uniref:DUF1674 domain-containing protein n=1 Tax=Dokdonella sp. TaxID=2291710 RepID=UPI003AF55648